MAKKKTVYFCAECGYDSPKWMGKCPGCGKWNTFSEETIIEKKKGGTVNVLAERSEKPQPVHEVSIEQYKRISTYSVEFNRILGGGLVPGALILLGGEPGIGKSTLALQIALNSDNLKVLYVSGEESTQQIKQRSDRIGIKNEKCLIYSETDLRLVLKQIEEQKPDLVVIDSIQTLQSEEFESSAGSITQVRECTASLLKSAKKFHIPVILIGHINKEGHLAGPKILEHIVDAVLQFEGDQNHIYRLLRSIKNRFGSTNELGIYEMQQNGLMEVKNPSETLINQLEEELSGIAVAATVDGVRPLLIETQALVSTAAYGTPQRSATGFDIKRLNMLLAVLEKRAGFRLSVKDVFLNMAGGIKITDPATDLAIVSSVLSSAFDLPVSNKICFSAEIGLSGEIRPVSRIENRISEAEKIGFEQMVVSRYNLKGIDANRYKIKIRPVGRIEELVKMLFR
jgi:DNA repair protein RadA/Sms